MRENATDASAPLPSSASLRLRDRASNSRLSVIASTSMERGASRRATLKGMPP